MRSDLNEIADTEHISAVDVTAAKNLVTSQTNSSWPLYQKLDSSINLLTSKIELPSPAQNVNEVKGTEVNIPRELFNSTKFHVVPLNSKQFPIPQTIQPFTENTQLSAQPETVKADQRVKFKVSRESIKSRGHRIIPLGSTISSLSQIFPSTQLVQLPPPVKCAQTKQLEWINAKECLKSANIRVIPLSSNVPSQPKSQIVKKSTRKKAKISTTSFKNPEDSCEIKINNLVTSANVMCPLNLKEICLKIPKAQFAEKHFQRVNYRLKENGNLLQLYSNGKIICNGAKTVQEAKETILALIKKLKKLKYPARFSNFKVVMMATSANLKFPLELREAYTKLTAMYGSEATDYTPDRVFALYYRPIGVMSKMTFIIYSSGNIVITGVKDEKFARVELEKIYPILAESKKL